MSWESFYYALLIPLLLFFCVYKFYYSKKQTPSIQYSSLKTLKAIPLSLRVYLSYLPLFLKLLALILVVIALMRPQIPTTSVLRNVEGIDIMLVLDISDSMLIEDMQPENRIEAAKVIMEQFVKERVSDRIGLIVFAGEAYTRVPLTLDYPLLLDSIRDIEITGNVKKGTAIGVALANAVARMKDSEAKNRVIVFLTDGENNTGMIDPETALDLAIGYGLKIYSVGIGRDGQAQLPVYLEDASGRRIKQYRPIFSQINEPLLRKFASETGGQFWRANTTDEFKGVFRDINELEKTLISVDESVRYEEVFQRYLFPALLIYLFGALLGRTVLRRGP